MARGVTLNSDIHIRIGKAAIIAVHYGKGAGEISQTGRWISELDYDARVWDMTIVPGGDFDGDGDNTFGIRTDLAAAAQGYRYVSNPTQGAMNNRPLGFAVQAESQFKELSVNNIDLVRPASGAQTVVYGVKMQSFNIRANLTATPFPDDIGGRGQSIPVANFVFFALLVFNPPIPNLPAG